MIFLFYFCSFSWNIVVLYVQKKKKITLVASSYAEITEHLFITAFMRANIISIILGAWRLRPIKVKWLSFPNLAQWATAGAGLEVRAHLLPGAAFILLQLTAAIRLPWLPVSHRVLPWWGGNTSGAGQGAGWDPRACGKSGGNPGQEGQQQRWDVLPFWIPHKTAAFVANMYVVNSAQSFFWRLVELR